jgi:uncharacterized protein (TIGR03437 family)
VVLLNGWITGFVNSCPVATDSTQTFGNLANYLLADGVPVVYFFDNCQADPNQPIETLGNDLAAFLNTITYDDGTPVPQIDLVAHSMGGLIARSYLAGLQINGTLTPPVNPRIRKLVLIATPNFGSFVAQLNAAIINPGTQSEELIPGSSLLWNLATWNQRIDDLRGVDAIAVIGNAGGYTNYAIGAQLANASDGLVSTTSASLSFVAQQPAVTRIVPYCHVDPYAFTNASLGAFNCNAPGIANVTDQNQYTGRIVRSFLSGTTDWQSIGTSPANDLYLTTDGGTFFAMVNGSGSYVNDVSQVVWGSTTLQNGGDTNTIFVNDFSAGTGDFRVTSASLGTIDCGVVTEAIGYVAAARCKLATAIISIGPLVANTSARLLAAGSTITITGASFGGLCNGCKVTAEGQALPVSSWKSNAITATLPATLTGLATIQVLAQTGNDSINVIIAPPAPAAPAISSVVNAGSFQSSIAAGTWVAIFGTGLATTTYTWQQSDFVNGQPPTTLQGVSVTIDGKPAAVEYVSATQINVLAPADTNIGSVAVQETLNGQASNSVNIQMQQHSPAFFTIDGSAVAAQHADYSLVSAANPAKAGEVILLYGTGFGSATAADVQVTIGGAPASVSFAGAVEAGLDQLNVTVPAGVGANPAVVATVGGLQTQSGVVLP